MKRRLRNANTLVQTRLIEKRQDIDVRRQNFVQRRRDGRQPAVQAILDSLKTAFQSDELAVRLNPAMKDAKGRATRLLIEPRQFERDQLTERQIHPPAMQPAVVSALPESVILPV